MEHILYPVDCCSPQDIKCAPQDITHRIYHPLLRNLLRNIGYILWICPVEHILYPVDNILYPVGCCSPQDIKCDVQDITHRIYHPLLRNLLRNIGYILWIYPVDNIYILWTTTEIVLPTGYKMLPTGYVCSTGYIYPVEHMTIVTYRMSPTGLKSVHRIYPQDIIFYILWVYPVDNILYIL